MLSKSFRQVLSVRNSTGVTWISDILSPYAAHDDFLSGLVLDDHVRGEDAAPVGVRIDDRAAADDAAGVEDGVAADVRVVAEERAEFSQPGVVRRAVDVQHHVAGHELDVGDLHARAEVRLVTEN